MRVLFTAEVVTAEEAKAIGLVEEAVPSAELLDHSRNLAERIA
jgi:enoyl-CoA hydratase/carnithine racemase